MAAVQHARSQGMTNRQLEFSRRIHEGTGLLEMKRAPFFVGVGTAGANAEGWSQPRRRSAGQKVAMNLVGEDPGSVRTSEALMAPHQDGPLGYCCSRHHLDLEHLDVESGLGNHSPHLRSQVYFERGCESLCPSRGAQPFSGQGVCVRTSRASRSGETPPCVEHQLRGTARTNQFDVDGDFGSSLAEDPTHLTGVSSSPRHSLTGSLHLGETGLFSVEQGATGKVDAGNELLAPGPSDQRRFEARLLGGDTERSTRLEQTNARLDLQQLVFEAPQFVQSLLAARFDSSLRSPLVSTT